MTDKEFVLSRYPTAFWCCHPTRSNGGRIKTFGGKTLSGDNLVRTEPDGWAKAAKQIRKNEKEQAAKDKANQK